MRDNGAGISLLVPYRAADEGRDRAWAWLEQYWRWALPAAQLVVADDGGTPFSKAATINQAAARADGDVFVIMDSDCYMAAEAILRCVQFIRRRPHTWWMPYRAFWRLRQDATNRLLAGRPDRPLRIALPPPAEDVQGGYDVWDWAHQFRKYGALIQVMPAAAFWEVGGMDPRFRGWGSEDSSFAMALDTLWAPRSYNNKHHAAHLWHHRIGEGGGPARRMWEGQLSPGANHDLKMAYKHAWGDRRAMRRLVKEGFES